MFHLVIKFSGANNNRQTDRQTDKQRQTNYKLTGSKRDHRRTVFSCAVLHSFDVCVRSVSEFCRLGSRYEIMAVVFKQLYVKGLFVFNASCAYVVSGVGFVCQKWQKFCVTAAEWTLCCTGYRWVDHLLNYVRRHEDGWGVEYSPTHS